MTSMELRHTKPSDLEQFFLFQLDEEACWAAAFMSKDHADKEAFLKKYNALLKDDTISMRTIVVDGEVAGSVSKYMMDGEAEITYWLNKAFWGRGIASRALEQFLKIETTRPIYGRVAFDNVRSQKVLENNNFVKIGADSGFSTIRSANIEEYIYKLTIAAPQSPTDHLSMQTP